MLKGNECQIVSFEMYQLNSVPPISFLKRTFMYSDVYLIFTVS